MTEDIAAAREKCPQGGEKNVARVAEIWFRPSGAPPAIKVLS